MVHLKFLNSIFNSNSVFIDYFGFSVYTIILSVYSDSYPLNSYTFCFSCLITLGRFSNAMLNRAALFEDFNIPFSVSARKSRQNIGNKCDLIDIYGTLHNKCRIHSFLVVTEYYPNRWYAGSQIKSTNFKSLKLTRFYS